MTRPQELSGHRAGSSHSPQVPHPDPHGPSPRIDHNRPRIKPQRQQVRQPRRLRSHYMCRNFDHRTGREKGEVERHGQSRLCLRATVFKKSSQRIVRRCNLRKRTLEIVKVSQEQGHPQSHLRVPGLHDQKHVKTVPGLEHSLDRTDRLWRQVDPCQPVEPDCDQGGNQDSTSVLH